MHITSIRHRNRSFVLVVLASIVVVLAMHPREAIAQTGPASAEDHQVAVTDDETEAIDTFSRQFIWFRDIYTRDWPFYRTTKETRVYQGRHHLELSTGELYSEIGHSDIQNEYERRRALGVGLMIAGTVAPVGLGTAGIASYYGRNNDDGLAVALWGAIATHWLFYVGAYYWSRRDPLESHQQRELVEEYNRVLMEALDLAPSDIPADEYDGLPVVPEEEQRGPDSDDLYVDGHVGRDSIGLVMGFRF